jgi:hypothetical protein
MFRRVSNDSYIHRLLFVVYDAGLPVLGKPAIILPVVKQKRAKVTTDLQIECILVTTDVKLLTSQVDYELFRCLLSSPCVRQQLADLGRIDATSRLRGHLLFLDYHFVLLGHEYVTT